MFGAYKFRDQIAMQDTGYLQAFVVSSASSVYYTGSTAISTYQTIGGSNNFHKLVYRLYLPMWKNSTSTSAFCHSALNLYLASPVAGYGPGQASSSVSSVSSNWSLIDSANCTFQFVSSTSSVSSMSATWVGVLDVRPEKFSGSAPVYITPVIATDSNAAGSAVLALGALVCDAYSTDYGPASNFDQSTVYALETDYL